MFSNTFVVDVSAFKKKLLYWSDNFSHVCILDSGNFETKDHPAGEGSYDLLAGIGYESELQPGNHPFDELKIFYDTFSKKNGKWIFGYFSYDLKNEIEKLTSENFDGIQFPKIIFFVPEFIFELKGKELTISTSQKNKTPQNIFDEIMMQIISDEDNHHTFIQLTERISKKEYDEKFNKILKHIQRGDIYELNYCIEFYSKKTAIDPKAIFKKLCKISPAPFSCYYKLNERYLISSSPERFLRKRKEKIISQPIKGTIRRGKNEAEDLQLKKKLFEDEKERSENVMIVDLVRNDLSRIAERGSVKVDELFGIYSFSRVHQMISTISCIMKENVHPVDVIKAAFPMGSMTGAPKVKAMELIEKYESIQRGLFSGAVGYFSPHGDFDFNVVIRSILYNAVNYYLSVMVGGAITAKANADDEYNECVLKAGAMRMVLANKN